jgi:serine/threonine-protein kinase RsbT
MLAEEFRIRVAADLDIARAVMQTRKSAETIGFRRDVATLIATAASELARNMVKYAGGGDFTVRGVERDGREGIELVATDRGPGIADIDAAMRDHVSSSGTLGLGLPGVKRMMDAFEIRSQPGQGTRVRVAKWR